ERGKLWMLQTRTGKRTVRAAVKIAVDMAKESLISRETAVLRVSPDSLEKLLHPTLDPNAAKELIAKGLPASPGAAVGRIVLSADEAESRAKAGEKVVLVRVETSPDDIHGMHAAEGILTARGGMTCIAGETRILTERGLMTAEIAFKHLDDGGTLRILSVDSASMRSVWREVIAAGKRNAEAITVSVSQTGRVNDNTLRITEDHKMLVLHDRALAKKPLRDVLAGQEFVLAVDQLPAFGETATSASLAYVAGAILSDGYVRVSPTKGYVTFIQKPTGEKAAFIAAVERAFMDAFGVPFSYVRQRETTASLRGRQIRGSVEDRICFGRAPAERLAWIRDNLASWVLSLDATALRSFLAGYVDGDGTYAEEASGCRIQISVGRAKSQMLDGIALACLRLGIVPQITSNCENWTVQIADKVAEILAFTQRVHAVIPPRLYESRCLSVRGLFADIGDQVDFMGRVKEGAKRNLMFGAAKIRRDIAPLCPGDAARELDVVLGSSLRSHRIKKVAEAEPTVVYNFEVDARDELDKNFVVFTSRLTPVLVSNSHAAVVARGMGKCCVAGCGALRVDAAAREVRVGGHVLRAGDWITLDGATGEVFRGEVPTVTPELGGAFSDLMRWADAIRTVKVRTNADTPADAKLARTFGAEGIGLCRTEHMFFEPDRILVVREMILANDGPARERALAKLLPMQRSDFAEIFRAMAGLPVTIRLLDPPLHEFLPHGDAEIAEVARALGRDAAALRAKVEDLSEFNPMLGHRGCRLGISFPEIYRMQVRAIMEAACDVSVGRGRVLPEIMLPLIAHRGELQLLRALVED
ncbi:MAG TPA: putative PEP-binding protein, partial [Myxococcota bacterium]|nr:putative PEP-binding protein [Myxococcota bacterium]